MSVRIFITGGTFDKEYDDITGKLYFQDTHMGEILELGRSRSASAKDLCIHSRGQGARAKIK